MSRAQHLLSEAISKEDEVTVGIIFGSISEAEAEYILEQQNHLSHTSLHSAVELGNDDIVKALIEKGADIEAATSDGIRSLHMAARHGHITMVETLIAEGADVDTVDNAGNTVFHHIAKHELREERVDWFPFNTVQNCLRILRIESCDDSLEQRNSAGETPLLVAARSLGFLSLSFFMENKAALHATDPECNTPLHLVAKRVENGDVTRLMWQNLCVRKLLNGGSTLQPNKAGKTPVDLNGNKSLFGL